MTPGLIAAVKGVVAPGVGLQRPIQLALALAVITTTTHAVVSLSSLGHLVPLQRIDYVLLLFLETLIACVAIVAAIVAAEGIDARGLPRVLLTLAIGAGLAVVLSFPPFFLGWPYTSAGIKYGLVVSPSALLLYVVWQDAMLALAAREWLRRGREDVEASRMLARLLDDQARIRRRVAESRLSALQARVDPAFFFEMLESVRAEYERDADRGEYLLDELTDFLRASLPSAGATWSSLGRECRLVATYARLRREAGLGSPELQVESSQRADEAPFPPGVLLPLLAEPLARAAGTISVVVRVELPAATNASGGRAAIEPMPSAASALQMEIDSGDRGVDAAAIARADSVLRDLFGSAAAVSTRGGDGGLRLLIRLPHEPVRA